MPENITVQVSNDILDDITARLRSAVFKARTETYNALHAAGIGMLVTEAEPIAELQRSGGRPSWVSATKWTAFRSAFNEAKEQLALPAPGIQMHIFRPAVNIPTIQAFQFVPPAEAEAEQAAADAAGAGVDELVDVSIPGYELAVPSFYERHRSKILIGGAVALVLGGGFVAMHFFKED